MKGPAASSARQWRRAFAAAATLVLALAIALVFQWWHARDASAPGAAPAGDAAPSTASANASVAKSLDLADTRSFEDAKRGLLALPSGKVLAADGSTVWDFDRFRFLEGDAPPTVNPSLWRHAKLNNQVGLFKVVDGIWQLRGFDLANITLIEGKTGWIVVDTLTTQETAAAAMAFARQHLGNKPVSAIVFTHSHADHFGGALGIVSAEDAARRKLPIVAPEGFLEEATSENILVGPAMGRRATFQFGTQLQASSKGLVDAGLGKGLALGRIGILPPNLIVDKTPQEMTLDGVRFVFQNVPASEAPSELAFYLPDFKAYCGAEILTQSMHNLYTLRGAKVRDALRWSGYIDDALQRFGGAEVFFASHHWPVWGNAQIVDFMKKHRDSYRYIHDQTVRLLNAGMKPHEIAETLKLPKTLESAFAVRGYYGTVRHNAKAVYQHYIGWFDGNPANLDPLPRQEAATRYVALMGGADKTVAAAQAAFERGEFRWVAELLNQVVFAQPDHTAARVLLARSYDQLAYAAESAIWRNFYLTGAQELRSGKTGNGPDAALVVGMLGLAPVERHLDAMAAGLNGPKADGSDLRLNLVFSDLRESYVLWIENAVLHHRKAPPDKNANATLTLTQPVFIKMVTGTAGMKDTLLSDDLQVGGSRIDLVRFFSLIDRPPKTFAIVTP